MSTMTADKCHRPREMHGRSMWRTLSGEIYPVSSCVPRLLHLQTSRLSEPIFWELLLSTFHKNKSRYRAIQRYRYTKVKFVKMRVNPNGYVIQLFFAHSQHSRVPWLVAKAKTGWNTWSQLSPKKRENLHIYIHGNSFSHQTERLFWTKGTSCIVKPSQRSPWL